MSEQESKKERQVLQLLRDYRSWYTPFGGAAPLDESANMTEASYGPAGIILAGMAFAPIDRQRLRYSFRKLNVALGLLQRDHMALWVSLVEPYLKDEADPGVVAYWRERLARLDAENQRRKRAKKPPKVALVTMRMMLERHDKATSKLVEYLRDVDLHHVPARVMSEHEEAKTERQNAEVYAVFQRLRVSGLTQKAATEQTAENFGVSTSMVERVVEFRSDVRLATCTENGCDKVAYQQNMCQKHYQRAWRARSKNSKAC